MTSDPDFKVKIFVDIEYLRNNTRYSASVARLWRYRNLIITIITTSDILVIKIILVIVIVSFK